MDFKTFTDELEKSGLEVHGVEVCQNGELTHEWGDTQTTRFPIWSATKSFVSAAFGIAQDEGLIRPEDLLVRYIPQEYLERITSKQRKQIESLPLRRLMCMSVAGLTFRAEGENWLDDSLAAISPEWETPTFNYSNLSTYLVGAALTQAVGEDLYSFMDRRLFRPLGIINPPYQRSPEGYFYGASGMELTVRELSRLGLMISAGGEYQGKRIVSAEYIAAATSIQQMNREGGYGYFFWKYRDGFSINGKFGQKCYCLPSRRLVITFLSHLEDGFDRVKEWMERYLLDEEKDS